MPFKTYKITKAADGTETVAAGVESKTSDTLLRAVKAPISFFGDKAKEELITRQEASFQVLGWSAVTGLVAEFIGERGARSGRPSILGRLPFLKG